MAEEEKGFFSRWSHRKVDTRQGRAPSEPAPAPALPLAPTPAASDPAVPADRPPPAAAPLPTLEDARQLTAQSDFRPFVARGVTPEVRNAAFKQLFTDPHFNRMDGLDVYIDDYSQPSPLPVALARQMASAQFLGLFDEKSQAQGAQNDNLSQASVAQSGTASAHPPPPETSLTAVDPAHAAPPAPAAAHDPNADLQLQPDPAPERASPRGGAG